MSLQVERESRQTRVSSGAPEVTVSMPAHEAARFIGEAIRSVLAQDVQLLLIVIDDGSRDQTANVVREVGDGRVHLVRNAERRGVAFCHNLALDLSRSPFIAHVDADDVIDDGALGRMLAVLRTSPRVGQVYAHYLEINECGEPFGVPFDRQRRQLLAHRPPELDYRRALLVHGMVVNPMRVYRREVFDSVGRFDERLRYAVDYEMALRIADAFDIALVPEFLYRVRIHDRNLTETLRLKYLRFWWTRLRICRRLLAGGRPSLLGRSPSQVYALMALGLLHTFEIPRTVKRIARLLRPGPAGSAAARRSRR